MVRTVKADDADRGREERGKWMNATEHPATCGYVNGPKPPCTCGAHARLAELHGEVAKIIRARGQT